jgi:hypothetical protein
MGSEGAPARDQHGGGKLPLLAAHSVALRAASGAAADDLEAGPDAFKVGARARATCMAGA